MMSWRTVVTAAFVILTLLTACGSNERSADPTTAPATKPPAATSTTEPTQPAASADEETTPTKAPAAEPIEATEEKTGEIPFDVPVMEGATEINIQKGVGAVTYVMRDTEIDDVVEFYQTSMVEQGWRSVRSSAIGLMANMVFESDQARLGITLQANTIGKMVTVALSILEK
jgi:hypothetical protein